MLISINLHCLKMSPWWIFSLCLSLSTLLSGSLFMSSTANAQEFPAVVVKDEDTGQYLPLRIDELKIDIKAVANIATTTMSMSFYNDLDRVLEGQLSFPLGEGQTVSRFAMDVSGKLREGVVVEKAKGRQVFESIVREQIDPGLLEWTKGNNFRSRVYPIPAKGHKKIVVAYEQELIDGGDAFLYALPLKFKDKVKLFSVRVEVFKQEIEPGLDENELENFQFEKWHESYLAETKHEDYLPNKQLAFTLPKRKDRRRVFIEEDENQSYFYLNIDPEIMRSEKELPNRICLLWDVSNSAASKDVEKELAVLDGYFKGIGNLKVDLVLFSNDIEPPEIFRVKNGNWQKLSERLRNLTYDGGTQLGAIDLSEYSCDKFILSTDGISNFGESEIKLSKTPVMVLNSCSTAEHSYLRYIAQATGGVYLNLPELAQAQAVELLSSRPYSFISATYNKSIIKETYPSIPAPVNRDFSISGILLKDRAEITLNFGFGGKIEHSQKFVLDKSKDSSESGLAKRIWAQKKIAELDMMYKKNEKEITDLGKELSIVTRNTSLIVLDRLEDYVRYRIVPPKEMQKKYFSMVEHEKREKERTEKEHLNSVAEKFKMQIEWWNKKFPFGKPKPKKEVGYEDEEEMMERRSRLAGAAASPEAVMQGATGVEFDELAVESLAGAAGVDGKEVEAEEESPTGAYITLSKWDPKTPYLNELRKKKEKDWYHTYLEQKKKYSNSSAFYLDVADFFLEKNKPGLALRILSNIAEMELENHQLLRILGHRLEQLKHYELAISVFKEVLRIREEEPQSYRDLGLVYSANKQYREAVDMLYTVVKRQWDGRFPEIELIALHEMNAIIATCGEKLNLRKIDKRLLKNLPVDTRVVLNWDADNCDMDLWVIDPNGEQCDYSNRETYIGGRMSPDFTQGYGPEEFMLKKAQSGEYTIKVNYYGNTQQVLAGATTIQVILITDFGKGNEQQKAITMRLKDEEEVIEVGKFEFAAEGK